MQTAVCAMHDDVIKWKHFSRYWPFVLGIHRSPVNSPHKGQWRGALMFSLICVWINGWVNNREAGDFSRRRAHYDVTVVCYNDSGMTEVCRLVIYNEMEKFCQCDRYRNITTHYSDVIMFTMASQITNLAIVYSTIYLGADQRKHQSSAVLALCDRWIPRTKGQ